MLAECGCLPIAKVSNILKRRQVDALQRRSTHSKAYRLNTRGSFACMAKKNAAYRFSFGPWNISQGADPFGPIVRKDVPFAKKVAEYRKLGFTHVQLHDDDVVPADWDATQTAKGVAKVKKMLEGEGLKGEFIAPRLWRNPARSTAVTPPTARASLSMPPDATRRPTV